MVRFVLASKQGHALTHNDYRQIAAIIMAGLEDP